MNKQEIAAMIDTELKALFPNSGAKAMVRNIIGDIVMIQYTHNVDASTCSNRILENDPRFMRFIIQSHRNGFYVESPSTHGNTVMGYKGVLKFRKISCNTELEVATRLISWFKKNREIIANVA